MVTFEQIVNSSILDIIVPNVSFRFPTQDIDHSPWLEKLRSEQVERKRAFFDEFLDFFFLLHLEEPGEEPVYLAHPPFTLLSFLAHAQVSYDATYISRASASTLSAPPLGGTPPRTTSLKPNARKGANAPPGMFPVNTPNPTPVTTEQNRPYVRAEGVKLASGIWGEEPGPVKERPVETKDSFALLWDKTSGNWVAVYRMCVNVAFLQLPFQDPLLCLTASITVRESPVLMTPARSVLAAMVAAAGGFPESPPPVRQESFNDENKRDKSYHSLDEVNLLEGLSLAPTLVRIPSALSLPSTRISARTRKQEFVLPSDPISIDGSVTLSSFATRATLRKSFCRTLSAVSAFRMRMRTVFVPYILLDTPDPDPGLDDALMAGHAEHTVMLCVELEHPGEAPEELFSVDSVDITVGGGGARARLLPWSARSLPEMFPLKLGVHQQYNLLFAVELLSPPVSEEETLLGLSTASLEEDLRRPVAITVRGRPSSGVRLHENEYGDRTEPFISRWNCVLDLAPQRHPAAGRTEREVLPEPPSPFPHSTPRISMYLADQQVQSNPVAGAKQFTIPSRHRAQPHSFHPPHTPTGLPGSTPLSSSPLSRLAYTPTQVTTINPGIPPPTPLNKMLPMGEVDEAFMSARGGATPPPPTPAYPAFSKGSPVPATPRAQDPLATGAPPRPLSVPSPVPSASAVPEHERIIVSVGLHGHIGTSLRRLVPHDEFMLDIFVFNQSPWTRRFEVSFFERRRRRQGHARGRGQENGAAVFAGPYSTRGGGGTASCPGIVPLESRVRVGPLQPATSQSVTMAFLALAPGMHTIEALILTDIETQHALILRPAMDVVVYEK
ncbi:TRAPP trafficking subunit Trs65-domain-containing protein [Lactifluus volemus]|nr:TRAPP trafficking subunit Trs65-domain-containing protein [Lactifluus volemus]KAH9953628.1 TRAPP trafficking subunit Trs65-domain-containing protein [Lactifluus volemus]